MILTLTQLAEDFKRFFHASIVDRKHYQDVYYMGDIYRVTIRHKRRDPDMLKRLPIMHRKPMPFKMIEFQPCATCKGPARGPVCILRGCDVVIKT